jgi:hypothetical protein
MDAPPTRPTRPTPVARVITAVLSVALTVALLWLGLKLLQAFVN